MPFKYNYKEKQLNVSLRSICWLLQFLSKNPRLCSPDNFHIMYNIDLRPLAR